MRRVFFIFFLLLVLPIPSIFALNIENHETERVDLQSPEIFEGFATLEKISYEISGKKFDVYILNFNSDDVLADKINYTLDDVDIKNTRNYGGEYVIIYQNYVEWISKNKIIHIEGPDTQSVLESEIYNQFIFEYSSNLNDYTRKNEEVRFASALINQASPCDECGAGLFNNCDKNECYSLSDSCYLTFPSCLGLGDCVCLDGNNLQNGDDSYCNYKGQREGGCLRNEYDCDSNSQCSSGLMCVGTILGEDGCCNVDETWDQNLHRCTQLVNEPSITNKTYKFGDIDYSLYRGKWKQGPICVVCPPYVWNAGDIDFSKRPVLLIHGWGNDAQHIESNPNGEWDELQEELEDLGYQVWRLQYSPANLSNRKNAGMVSDAIEKLLDYGYDQHYSKIDVISHSMGGLATRGYIQSLGVDENGMPVSYDGNIRNYIIIASPTGGTYFANIIDGITPINIANQHPLCQNLINDRKLWGGSEATKDMEIGSDFTWELNNQQINNNINYLVIAGTRTLDRNLPVSRSDGYCLSNWGDLNDGVVSAHSPSLIQEGYPLILLDSFHSTIKFPFVDEGIDSSQKVAKVANLFFNGNLNRQTINPLLDKNAFYDEIYYHPTQNSDFLPLELRDYGGIVIQVNKSEVNLNENSVKINDSVGSGPLSSSLIDLQQNSLTKRWFYAQIINNLPNEKIDFSTRFINIGTQKININGHNFDEELDIEEGITNFFLIVLDKDNDGFDMLEVGGSDCSDTNPLINPNANEICNEIDDNCNSNIDEGFDKGDICTIGIGECLVEGFKICSQDGLGTICDASPKDPSNEVCDNLDNDCDGEIDEEEVCEEEISLQINSPQNQVYNDRRIPFEIELNEIVDEITYIDLADDRGRERRLCSNCDSYGLDRIRTQSFVDGGHNISIKAMKDEVVVDEKIVSFMTDSRDPRISRTEPRRGFSNGIFNVEFTEENPTELILFYGNSIRNKTVDIENDCVEARRGFECETEADVSDFDGGNIEYWFELIDVAGSKDESRHEELNVDISPPIIENLEYEVDGRNVYFTMRVIENNLDEVYYLDNSDERARERSICRRLSGDLCEGRASFRDGEHNITIYAVDEAGNMAKEDLLFFVDSRDPRISRTEPRRGFASGIFNVEFTEENPVSLFLNYGNSQTGFRNKEVEISSSCIIDRRYECETEVNLSDYHGQEIAYWFNISDILNQTDESRETSLDVDSVAPILNNLDSFWEQGEGRYQRYIYFTFNVTEENFDEVNYLDLNDERARERRICSRLRDGVCEGRASFRSGGYELLIKILDSAGNSVEEFIEFTVS